MSKPTLTLEMVARAVCIEQVRAALAEEGEQEQPAPQGDKQLEKQPPTWLCDECRQQWIMADIAPERPRLGLAAPQAPERTTMHGHGSIVELPAETQMALRVALRERPVKDVAAEVGVSPSAISRMANHGGKVRAGVLHALATWLSHEGAGVREEQEDEA